MRFNCFNHNSFRKEYLMKQLFSNFDNFALVGKFQYSNFEEG